MLTNSTPFLLTAAFLSSFLVVLAGTYGVRGWARKKGYVDRPGGRRIHLKPTPNVGGIAVGLGTTAVVAAWAFTSLETSVQRPEIVWMLVGGLLMLLLGVRDDIQPLSARLKFFLQWVIASIVFLGGVRILGANVGTLWIASFPGWVSYAVTTFWIVGAANAFNLIDGSDGVAAGAALFASASLGVVFAMTGDPLGALIATVLVGACLGFLFFNFPPASVFLGDSGSLFLGYTLATLGVITDAQGLHLGGCHDSCGRVRSTSSRYPHRHREEVSSPQAHLRRRPWAHPPSAQGPGALPSDRPPDAVHRVRLFRGSLSCSQIRRDRRYCPCSSWLPLF